MSPILLLWEDQQLGKKDWFANLVRRAFSQVTGSLKLFLKLMFSANVVLGFKYLINQKVLLLTPRKWWKQDGWCQNLYSITAINLELTVVVLVLYKHGSLSRDALDSYKLSPGLVSSLCWDYWLQKSWWDRLMILSNAKSSQARGAFEPILAISASLSMTNAAQLKWAGLNW